MVFTNFHHLEFNVASANQSAYWYCIGLGFTKFAKKETDNFVSIAVKNKEVTLIFTSRKTYSNDERDFYILHGDTVTDVAFLVDDLEGIVEVLKTNKIDILKSLVSTEDQNGNILLKTATIRAQETAVLHTLIERHSNYSSFLPGFDFVENFQICSLLNPIYFERIDHVVQAFPIDSIETAFEWYNRHMEFKKFWSVDDLISEKEGTSLSAHMLTSSNEKIKYLAAESAKDRKMKSQIQEFIEFNGGSGIQHMALLVDDLAQAVVKMKERSVEFLIIPDSYYDFLGERLKNSKLECNEDLERLKEHRILMDFDDDGYLLQIFTKPLQDRPTMFIELIQRRNFDGFGAGNFKTLFKALEKEQEARGTLN